MVYEVTKGLGSHNRVINVFKGLVTDDVAPLYVKGDRKIVLGEGVLAMEICLHIGAHRTGTTSFQQFMLQNGFAAGTGRDEVAFWGPMRTRRGLFSGLIKNPVKVTAGDMRAAQRSCGRIKMEIARLERAGVSQLIVSEENMMGTMTQNLATARLYMQVRRRLGVFGPAFGGHKLTVMLNIRSYYSFWASTFAYKVKAGMGLPDEDLLDRISVQPRRWRDVIKDTAATFPEAEILVQPFEGTAGKAERQLNLALGDHFEGPLKTLDYPCNASASSAELAQIMAQRGEKLAADHLRTKPGRFMPFAPEQISKLRTDYDDDISWLRSGADGIATYIDPIGDTSDGLSDRQGRYHDKGEERVAEAS